jgi:F-type H+-transporting ATPase subunit alpha
MRSVSGTLRLDLSAYRELEAFAAFGSDLDDVSKRALARGSRLVELLKQAQFSPYPVQEQVVAIWAGTRGHMDRVPVQDIRRFEGEFLQYLRHAPGSPLDVIKEKKVLSDDTEKALLEALGEFSDTFTTSEGNILGRQAAVKPMDAAEVGQEKVQVQVRKPPAKK